MRNEPCFCGSEKKTKKCHKDIQPNSAFGELVQLHKRLDQEIENNKGLVPCKIGCANCCYEPFSISSSEYYLIANYMFENFGEEKAKEIIEKGNKIFEDVQIKYPKLMEKIEKNIEGDITNKDLKVIWDTVIGSSKLKYPCPFLNEDTMSCSIYDVRPFVCRTHGVGYLRELDKKPLCKYIPNGYKHQKNMADLTAFKDDVQKWVKYYLKGYKKHVYDRPYPIFYFMNLQISAWSQVKNKIQEFKTSSLEEIVTKRYDRVN